MSGPIVYGDDDPEDAFDRHDSVFAMLDNLRTRIRYLSEHPDEIGPRAQRILDVLAYIADRVRTGRIDQLDPADD